MGNMPHTKSKMVCRAFETPILDEGCHIRRKAAARIRVARWRNGPGKRLAFRDNEFEATIIGLRQANDGHGPDFQLEFNTDAIATLAVIDAQAAQHRPSFRDADMVRTVVTNEDDIILEVAWVNFRKAPASFQTVDDKHRQTVFDVTFTGNGRPATSQQRAADDEC